MNLKRTITFGALAAFLFAMVAPAASVQAAGTVMWPNIRLTANKSSTTANGSDAITITAQFFLYECNDIDSYSGKHEVYDSVEDCNTYAGGVKGETPYTKNCSSDGFTNTIVAGGEGVVLSKISVCADGETFTIKSSVVGGKDIKVVTSWPHSSHTQTSNTVSLNFSAAVAAPKPKAPPAPAPVIEKPAVPTVATVLVNDKVVTAG